MPALTTPEPVLVQKWRQDERANARLPEKQPRSSRQERSVTTAEVKSSGLLPHDRRGQVVRNLAS